MGYRTMSNRDLWEIYRRWCAGQSVSHIAESEGRDRKTVREYIEGLQQAGLDAEGPLVEQQEFYRRTSELLPRQTARPKPAREQLQAYREEIREMVNRKEDPLVAKYAFLVIKQKYRIEISYTTFKRVAREEGLTRAQRPQMIRICHPSGELTRGGMRTKSWTTLGGSPCIPTKTE